MVNNNGNGNGKKTIELNLSSETYRNIEDLSDSRGQSVNTFLKEAVNDSINRAELHSVIKEACDEERLSADSKVCKFVEKSEQHHSHVTY